MDYQAPRPETGAPQPGTPGTGEIIQPAPVVQPVSSEPRDVQPPVEPVNPPIDGTHTDQADALQEAEANLEEAIAEAPTAAELPAEEIAAIEKDYDDFNLSELENRIG